MNNAIFELENVSFRYTTGTEALRNVNMGTPREIFNDVELLRDNNLEVPEVYKLFEVLRCFGYPCEELPLSIDDAVAELTKTINSRHIHLHIHEHTHEDVKRVRGRYEHHE